MTFKQRSAQAAKHFALLLSRSVKLLVLGLRKEPLAQADGGMRYDFEERARCNLKEPGKVRSGVSRAAFSNVRGHGNGGTSHLVCESKSLVLGKSSSQRVNKVRKLNCALPRIELFEVKHGPDLSRKASGHQLTTVD